MSIKLTPQQWLLMAIFAEGDFVPELDEKGTQAIYEVLETLKPREQAVIKLRFGFGGQGAKTLREVGKVLPRYLNGYSREVVGYGVCQERVRQIEAKALRKLRHPSRSRKLIHIWRDSPARGFGEGKSEGRN